ncbi:MAG TPA: ATP-grasp domain-containing protein [Deltaproteobacteria bacterium]|nr:ATP-grasp domain-containing protein [Deltaproteobacteria bacterium]
MNAVVPTSFGDHIGLAVVRSLGKNNVPMTVISNDRNALPFYSRYCSRKIVTEYDDEFLSGLTEDDLIMPNGGEDILFFAKNAPLYDYDLAFPDSSTLEAVVDKSQLMQFAITHTIPIPDTFFVNSPDDLHDIHDRLKFPAIIKPTLEKSGRGIVRVESPDMIEEMYTHTLNQFGPSIIQEYIPFKKRYSVATLISKDYKIQRICIIQDNRIYPLNTGTSCFVETVHNSEILDLTFAILKSLRVWGMTELEFIIDERDGKPKFLEINPRFWGSIQCAISAGVDFPFLLHKMVTDNNNSVSYDYASGVTGRYLFPKDLLNLVSVLKGRYPFSYKMKTAADFLKFYPNNTDYIFSLTDMKPFLSLFKYYLLEKKYWRRPGNSATTSK